MRCGRAQTMLKALTLMLDTAGGLHLRQARLSPLGQRRRNNTPIDLGYNFIVKECPRTAENLARLRWVANQIADPASPIHNWAKADVKETIQTMHCEGTLATTQSYMPISLLDVLPTFGTFSRSSSLRSRATFW